MKSITTLFLIASLFMTTVILAKNKPTEDPLKQVSSKLTKLLEKPNFNLENEIKAMVTLVVNNEREIVVLSVDSNTEDMSFETYIKDRLNYSRIVQLKPKEIYKVPVKIISKEQLYVKN